MVPKICFIFFKQSISFDSGVKYDPIIIGFRFSNLWALKFRRKKKKSLERLIVPPNIVTWRSEKRWQAVKKEEWQHISFRVLSISLEDCSSFPDPSSSPKGSPWVKASQCKHFSQTDQWKTQCEAVREKTGSLEEEGKWRKMTSVVSLAVDCLTASQLD